MKLKTYTPEFRAEAVKLVLAQGLSLEEAAQRIAMPKGTLGNWVSAAKRGNGGAAAPGSRTVSARRTSWPDSSTYRTLARSDRCAGACAD